MRGVFRVSNYSTKSYKLQKHLLLEKKAAKDPLLIEKITKFLQCKFRMKKFNWKILEKPKSYNAKGIELKFKAISNRNNKST